MAEHGGAGADHHGDMPIKDHASTYHRVMGLFKWVALGVAALVALLIFWFCTPAGPGTGFVVAVVMVVAGVFALRDRKTTEH
jgi:hypothetical protein